MSNGLVLLGGGGHCKSVIDTIKRIKEGNERINSEMIPFQAVEEQVVSYREIVLTDASLPKNSFVHGIRIAGSDDSLGVLYANGFRDAFITVGSITDTQIRRRLYSRIKEIGFRLINIMDPTADVSDTAIIDGGTFVGKKSVVNADCLIGDMAIINTGVILEHGCSVGAFSHISIGAILCGDVTVGKDVFIGAGVTVIQGISIGDSAIIGAGSTVLRDVDAKERVNGIVK